MQSAAQRMSQLITDLLAFSRITTTGKQPRPCELSEIVNDILEDLAIPIEEYQVNILVHKLPKVRVDASQLAIVFQNLISNAIKFREPSRPLEIEISAEQIPDCWLIHVADNGIGFNEQFTEKIFQIFQRLHNKQKIPGTGIGLAICRRIMERHGGNIIVESKPNKGSKFTLKLPERIFDEENNNELQAD